MASLLNGFIIFGLSVDNLPVSARRHDIGGPDSYGLGIHNVRHGGKCCRCLRRWLSKVTSPRPRADSQALLQLDDNSPRNFGDTISGWWLMIMRWNPFSNARTIPAITEIQSRLA